MAWARRASDDDHPPARPRPGFARDAGGPITPVKAQQILGGAPMLKLYSFGPAANSLKPLLALNEKGVPFESRFLSAAKFEQHEPWFTRLNPNGQAPALEHDGKIITESTVICEYLEDVFTDYPRLRPADPYLAAQMRIWTKWVDEYFCWCVSTIGWHRRIGPLARSLSDADFEEQ